jgi:hypothetical protein
VPESGISIHRRRQTKWISICGDGYSWAVLRSEAEFLKDIVGRLNSIGVEYMLTGSMASNYWGIPRTTHDLDFVLVIRKHQVDSLVAVMSPDLFIQTESVYRAFAPPHQFNVIDNSSALKADFWMLREDPFDQTAFSRRAHTRLFGIDTWIASAEDVILHKLYWNRLGPSERQLGDAAGVFAVQAALLDLGYMQSWAQVLHVEPELTAIISGKIRPKST